MAIMVGTAPLPGTESEESSLILPLFTQQPQPGGVRLIPPKEWLILSSGLQSRASQQDDGGKEVRFWILIPAAAVGC